MPGGRVVTYLKMNCSKTIRNAMATTGMNEYWTNDLSQPQKSQSSFGTMKNGTKIGPSSPHTALAIRPNEMTASEIALATAISRRTVQYIKFARIDQGSGCRKWSPSSSKWR